MTTSHAQHGLVLGHIHFVIVGADLLLANGTAGRGTEHFQYVLGLAWCLIHSGAHIHLALLHDNAILVHLELGNGRAEGFVHETTLWHEFTLLVQLDAETVLDGNDRIVSGAIFELHYLCLVAVLWPKVRSKFTSFPFHFIIIICYLHKPEPPRGRHNTSAVQQISTTFSEFQLKSDLEVLIPG